ncbi:hypothetical protein LTS15_003137 [Exophiala xenobiotica]|nr:hypothetical protein LTS15_003137 [Exophiala xenobiotica]
MRNESAADIPIRLISTRRPSTSNSAHLASSLILGRKDLTLRNLNPFRLWRAEKYLDSKLLVLLWTVKPLEVVIIPTASAENKLKQNGARRNPKDDAGMAEALSEYDACKSLLFWQEERCSMSPVWSDRGPKTRVEVEVPSAPEDGLLVKIYAAGVCHSDVILLSAETKRAYFLDKYTLGHEGCGEVVSVGSAVTRFKPGDMVSVLSVPGCGKSSCPECTRGVPQLCSTGEHYGIGNDGSFASYIAIRERAAVRLPPGVSPAAGAVATDAVMTAYQAVVRRGKVKKDDTVLLLGLGGLGFNALQIILSIGARAIVVDQRQEVLDEAVKFGVKEQDVVPVGAGSIAEWVNSNKVIVDTAIDFVGVSQTFTAAIESVRMAGTVVLVGLLNPGISFNSQPAVTKQIDILCSYGGTFSDVEASLDLIAKGVITPQVETGSMKDFPRILDDLHNGKIKSRIALVPEGIE